MAAYVPLAHFRAVALTAIRRLDEAAKEADSLIESSRKPGLLRGVSTGHIVHAFRCELAGDARSALGHGRQAVESGDRTESEINRLMAYYWLGRALVLNEHWLEAVGALDTAREIGRSHGLLLWDSPILGMLALANLGLGNHDRARQDAEEAVAIARRIGAGAFELWTRLGLARILRETEGAKAKERIEGELGAALAFVETSGAKGFAPLVRVERAELARLSGDEATRQRELREAHRLFTEIGATGHIERLAREVRL